MSSLTSEIRRNAKLELFTRDGVAALYQEKGSKHQDQLSQSDSAARKTQPHRRCRGSNTCEFCCGTSSARKTHGKGISFYRKEERRIPSFLPPPLFLFFDCDHFFLPLGPLLSFGEPNFAQRGMLRVPEQHLQSEGT